MYVKYSHYGERYLPHRDFLQLCSDIGIKSFDDRISEKWLEYLEKNKILFPEYKLVKPKWYLNYFFKYSQSQLENIKSKRWKKLNKFYEHIEKWDFRYSIFHPFDKKKISSEFLSIPKEDGYSKWQVYYKKNISEDEYYSIEKDIYYYPYWRVYQLHAIDKACVQKYLINVFDEETNKQYLTLRKIPYTKAKSWSLPRSPDLYKDEIFGEDYNFYMLSFYIQSIRKVESVPISQFLKAYSDDLEERKRYNEFVNKRKARIANITICKYNLTQEKLIKFLTYLCERYFRYEEKNLLNLTYLLRADIIYLRSLLLDGYNLTNKEIEKSIKISFIIHKEPLRYIIMGELAEARQDSFSIFKDFIERTFIKNKIEINLQVFEDFLSFLDDNDMDTIYVTIYDYYYLPSDYRKYRDPITNLASLVVYFESYLRELIIKNYGDDGKTWLSEDVARKTLKSLINKLLPNEKWLDKLNLFWNDKIKSVTNTEISQLEKQILETPFHSNEQWNELAKIFALIGALRNYIAHDFFRFYKDTKHYDVYVKYLISAFWYCWQNKTLNEKK